MDHSLEIERLMRGTQQRIMSDVVRRIRINQNITRTADWQLDRLTQLGEGQKEVRRILQEQLGLTADEIEALYKEAAESGYARSEALYKAVGRDYIPPAENAVLQQLISSAAKQTGDELQNLTRSLGFAVNQGGKLKFKGIAKYYQDTLDGAITDISSGAFDYNTVIKRVITEMTNSGLRTVDYATGRHNRIDVAARRAVMTGMNQLTGKVQEDNADKLGTDKFEVSWHGTARPEHQEWQGKVYTKEQLASVCGLGSVTGLLGANCRHTFFPFIEGVSERIYTDEQLRAMNERENEPKYYNGKPYTSYEATQRQRYLETSMRVQRQKIKLLEEAGADEQDITLVKCKYRRLSQEYTAFSKQMGLPQERDRIYADGLGKMGGKIKEVSIAKNENSDIILLSKDLYGFGKINDQHDIANDIVSNGKPTCNPNFSTGQWGYTQNCQRCVQAYEFRRRGYDVVAAERPIKNNKIIWGCECFTDVNGNPAKFIFGQTESMVKKVLNSAPDGSRYTIYVKWKGRSTGAHVFVAEKENGVVRYIDPQNGSMDASGYFERGSAGRFGYFRMDDKQLTTDKTIINATMEERK